MNILWVVLSLTVISTVQSFSISTTSDGKAIWTKLWAAYLALEPTNRDFDIIIIPDAAAGMQLLHNGKVTSISSTDIKLMTHTAQILGTKFETIPNFFQPFIFISNVPQMGVKPLILNWDVLSEMFLGNINYWNDSRLVELNPSLVNATKPILHILRDTNTSATNYLSSIYSSISPEWNAKYGESINWPELNVAKVLTSSNVFATFAKVFANQYSFSYGTYPFFNLISSGGGINYAGFKQPNGDIVFPTQSDLIIDSIEDSEWHFGENVTGLDMDAPWPFIITGYLILPHMKNTNINCAELSDNLKFFRWIYTDCRAKKVADSEGYYLPPAKQREEIVKYLDSITCNGHNLLKVKLFKSPSQEGKWIAMAFFWVLVLLSMLMFGLMNFEKTIDIIYAVILVIGEILCGASMILWAFPPFSNWNCIGRWWLMGLGLVIFSGGVFCRSYQLKKIHYLVKRGRYQSAKYLNHIKLLSTLMGLITVVELIILIVLQIFAPFKSELIVFDSINLLGEFRCTSNMTKLWIYVQSSYLFCILFLGVYFIYSTWRISSSVDDTRINILMFFGCLITIIVDDVIWAKTVKGDDLDTWWAISMIMIWGLCMMCSVFVPKLVKAAKQSSSSGSVSKTSKSSDKNTNNTNPGNTLTM